VGGSGGASEVIRFSIRGSDAYKGRSSGSPLFVCPISKQLSDNKKLGRDYLFFQADFKNSIFSAASCIEGPQYDDFFLKTDDGYREAIMASVN
jgi:hypothetical protein